MNKVIKKQPYNQPPQATSKENRPSGSNIPQERLVHLQQHHEGPLPDPRTLEHYNTIVPGAAERILVMAEQNAQHSREMDKEILNAQLIVEKQNHSEARLGQVFAILSTLSAFGVSIIALTLGYPTVAGIICSTTVVGLVAVFVTGRKKTTVNKNGDKG